MFIIVLLLSRPRIGPVELVLFLGLCSVVGLVGFLLHDGNRSRLARAEEAKARRSGFREALVRELRSTPAGRFDFVGLTEACEVPQAEAAAVADELYSRLAAKVVADGIITPDERSKLDGLASTLLIDPARASRIESAAKGAVYRDAVSEVLADGVVSPVEAAQLESLRRSLGIGRPEIDGVTGSITRDAYLAMLRRIVAAGGLDARSEGELARFKRGLALGDSEAMRMIRTKAGRLYEEAFTAVVQDGVITRDEEEMLAWLQREVGLSDSEVEPFQARLTRAKMLSEVRAGRLPTVRTSKLLEGGEICHWDAPCRFRYETATRAIVAAGELIVTGKRLIFSSPTKTFSYPSRKILDIVVYKNALELKTEGRAGTGTYYVVDAESLEAVLVGVVRKSKYLITQGYSSTANRHIPGDVKQDVWHRDGGQCVQCGASGRGACLEYDHIIPHAKGGANTVANVQLLCRPCNAAKSDRI